MTAVSNAFKAQSSEFYLHSTVIYSILNSIYIWYMLQVLVIHTECTHSW